MPRVNVPLNTPTRAGIALTTTPGDATNHHVMVNDGRTAILIKNTGSTVARVVTFKISKKVDGQAVTARTASLVAGEQKLFGPFSVEEYGGRMEIDVAHAELTLTPIKL
ncbi:hypothetical protein ACIGW0_31665 [Streptomyces bikiniensis]|uniref:Uncharacterized protein n=1 Tax=Streptomyces bikiniensis TaxID=1896 RepID=A0ABW8D5H4_STRBI